MAPSQLDELLHPIVDPEAEKSTSLLAKGLPAGPGGATGKAVFTAQDAVDWEARGEKVVLIREETNPEDVEGMRASIAILTSRGGMTSHAALVARGWGMCCIVGAGEVKVDSAQREFTVGGTTIRVFDRRRRSDERQCNRTEMERQRSRSVSAGNTLSLSCGAIPQRMLHRYTL